MDELFLLVVMKVTKYSNSVLDKWEYLRVFPMVSDDINELGVFPVKFYYLLKKEL